MNDTANPKPLAELIRHRTFRAQPHFWTEKHMQWVGCRFEDVDDTPEEGKVGSDLGYTANLSEEAILNTIQAQEWAERIVEESRTNMKTWFMTKLLVQVKPTIFPRRRYVSSRSPLLAVYN